MDNNWQVEYLVRQAFNRTKNKFLSYFLTIILNFGIWFGFIFLILFSFAICYLIYLLTKSVIFITLLGGILLIVMTIFGVYLGSWMQLALYSILIQEEKLGVIETFKKVRPLVNQYLWFITLYSLFILGLFPLGVLTLFIILILWSFWGSFSIFIYLDKRKKGLENLWISRNMVNQKFWAIAGRMLLINFAVFFISMILSSSKNTLLSIGTILLSIFMTPFVISFNYEMYKNLSEPKEIKKPVGWITFSVIGGILLIALLIFGLPFMIKTFSTVNLPNIPIDKFPITTPIIIPTFGSLPSSI